MTECLVSPWRHTTLIILFSSKVPFVSVAISIARIPTALFSKRFLRTNSSLQTIAAAPPSDVGLRKEESIANRAKGVPRPFLHSEKLAQVQKQSSLAWINWKINFQKIYRREICYFVSRRSKYHVQWFEDLPTFWKWREMRLYVPCLLQPPHVLCE